LRSIVNGAKPADLLLQRSTKLELAVNLKAAKAPGIDILRCSAFPARAAR
jgi:ABC-type uncharacterized transport system substrate-binding protein